jgi:hypothetical protein
LLCFDYYGAGIFNMDEESLQDFLKKFKPASEVKTAKIYPMRTIREAKAANIDSMLNFGGRVETLPDGTKRIRPATLQESMQWIREERHS